MITPLERLETGSDPIQEIHQRLSRILLGESIKYGPIHEDGYPGFHGLLETGFIIDSALTACPRAETHHQVQQQQSEVL